MFAVTTRRFKLEYRLARYSFACEPTFVDKSGLPIDLPFDGGEQTFSGLVKLVGGDVPAGAVRAELLAAGGIVELPNGKFRAQKRFFVPDSLR